MNREIRFGTDGWRAIIAQEFTVENVARLTMGLGAWIKEQDLPNRVVIGHDCRFAGALFSRTVATVLVQEGIEVLYSDRIVTTPMLAMAARDRSCAVGVMITASHNPPAYNGYKLKGAHGGPMGGIGLKQIEALVPEQLADGWALLSEQALTEKVTSVDIETPYVEAIEAAFDMDRIRAMSEQLSYDAMYGAGQFVMAKLLPEISHFRCEHNPTFYGLSPEPIARNLGAFSEYLKSDPALELGLVTDGDADRIGLMDGDGNFIDSHHIILLLIHYLVKYKGMQGKVVTAFSTVNKVAKLCAHYGLLLDIVKIGFKYASEVMVSEPVMLAGEESGGIAVETHIPERDGIWMGLMLMEFMGQTGKTINELIQEVYDIVGAFVFKRNDLRLSEEEKQHAIDMCRTGALRKVGTARIQRTEDLDGWKFIIDEDTWIMVRPSGTEPVLRIYVEAPDATVADRLLKDIRIELGIK